MSKAEEFLIKWFHEKYGKNARFIEREWSINEITEVMEQYAAEVSREVAEQAFKAGMVFMAVDVAKDFEEWWDWLKEQEE